VHVRRLRPNIARVGNGATRIDESLSSFYGLAVGTLLDVLLDVLPDVLTLVVRLAVGR
jgi:hypothetical protein